MRKDVLLFHLKLRPRNTYLAVKYLIVIQLPDYISSSLFPFPLVGNELARKYKLTYVYLQISIDSNVCQVQLTLPYHQAIN